MKQLSDFHSVTIGDCTLYRGDCVEIMPLLGEFDAVITDPPYGTQGTRGYGRKCKVIKGDLDTECFRALAQYLSSNEMNAWAFIFNSPKRACEVGHIFSKFPQYGQLVWDKKIPALGAGIRHMHELVNVHRIGRVDTLKTGLGMFRHVHSASIHPHSKPIELMKWCVQFLPENTQTVFDPFMGSGTTGVACVKLGRKFTGIELDAEYFDIACERIRKAYEQPDMFVAPPVKPMAIQEGFDL